MRARFGNYLILISLSIITLFGIAEAKRHSANDTATSPAPPPPELLALTPHDCTIPRQSLYAAGEDDSKLNPKLPAEIWFKFRYDGKGGKELKLVYCSAPDTAIVSRCEDIASRLILRTPVDSNTSDKWYYHRIVLLKYGSKMRLNQNAVPIPGDLPKPETVTDSNYTYAEIVKRAHMDVPEWAQKPGNDYSVLLRYHIRPDGTVDIVEIQKSSGNGTLDEIAKAAAYKNKYKAATHFGKPVDSWISDRIDFAMPTPERLVPTWNGGQ